MVKLSNRVMFAAGGAALLVLIALGVALAGNNATTNGTSSPLTLPWMHGSAGSANASRDANEANEPNEMGGRMAGFRGGFSETNGTVTAGPVTFHADPATGSISAVTLTNGNTTTTLLDAITVADLAGGAETARGPMYMLATSDARLIASAGPVPGLDVVTKNATTVTIALPAGATVVTHEAVSHWSPAGATVTIGPIVENLVASNGATMTASGNTLTITLPAEGALSLHLAPTNSDFAGGFGGFGHGFGFHGPRGFGGRGFGMPFGGGRGFHMPFGGFGGMGGPRGHWR
ncbi:MAG: hypothetical protein ACYDCK_12360 [Thermoplasmatota archaeon]